MGVRLLIAIVLAVVLTMAASDTEAQIDVPRGSIGFLGQVQQNTGEAGDAYRFAWLLGVTASYEVGRVRNLTVGAAWSWARGLYDGADAGLADERVGVLEMSLGMRVRRRVGSSTPRYFVAGAGATILRLDRALPPDDDRLYLGPYATVGLDQYLGAGPMISFALRYGLIGTGPASLGVRLGISFGS